MTAEHEHELGRKQAGPGPVDDWGRAARAWHLAFYAMVPLTGITLALSKDVSGGGLAIALGLLAALVVAYVLVGQRAVDRRDEARGRGYLALLIVVCTTLAWIDPVGSISFFIAYSQIWLLTGGLSDGVAWTVGFTAMATGAFLAQVDSRTAALGAIAQMSLSLAFSLVLGLWIHRLVRQSESRASLIAQLQQAQTELAAAHHARGVLAERERMAREIHDTLAQGFTSVVMLAQTAAVDVGQGHLDDARRRLALLEQTGRENLAEARALVAALAPAPLDGATLTQALRRLCDRLAVETGAAVTFEVQDARVLDALDRDTEVVLLRAAQEAIANVRKHAAATHVSVTLAAGGSGGAEAGGSAGAGAATVELVVVDDGRGIDPAAAEGFGLRGMRERLAGRGTMAIAPLDGGGTRLVVSLDRGTEGAR